MLAEGVATRRGRRSAHLHHDRVNGRAAARRGARLAAITSGGAIPDTADYEVVEEPHGSLVGTVNEDFAVESMARRHLPPRQSLVAHPARRERPDARRGRARRGAHDPVLARRGAGTDARAVGRGVAAAREVAVQGVAAPRRRGSKRSAASSPDAARRSSSRTSATAQAALGGVVPTRSRRRGGALLRRGGRHAARDPRAVRRAHQPRLRPRAAQALLRQLQLRAAGRRHRRRHRPVARHAAQLPARQRVLDAAARVAARTT